MAVMLAALTAMLAAPAIARAHFSSGLYSHARSDCASRVNPIGAVFYWAGTISNTQEHVYHHTGWGQTVIEKSQYFASHGVCYQQQRAHASDHVWNSRYHIRLNETYDYDSSLGYTTAGTPHWEEIVTCNDGSTGHAVPSDGFTRGRRALIDTVGLYHSFYYEWWGNTQSFTQCNDWVAAGDGVVAWFRI